MIRVAMLVVTVIGSTLLVSEVSQEKKTSPAGSQPPSAISEVVKSSEVIGESTGLENLGSALKFVGICSVVCSLIGGTVLITVSRMRERRLGCKEYS